MASPFDAEVPWERVASELRACREAQRRAWGDIDNTTLGRYLAGEASPDERRRVETALEELPELRRLTDLVRDVLEAEPIPEPEPAPQPEPVLLPFPRRRPLARTGRVARRGPLVAAACLLLTLGVAMPRPARLAPQPHDLALVGKGVASTRAVPLGAGPVEGRGAAGHMAGALARLDQAPPLQESLAVARDAQKKGDLARAERALYQAHFLCQKELGPTHPATQWTLRNLADCYQVALNTTPPASTGVTATPGGAAVTTPPRVGFSPPGRGSGEAVAATAALTLPPHRPLRSYLVAPTPAPRAAVAAAKIAPPTPPAPAAPTVASAPHSLRHEVRKAEQHYASALALRMRLTNLDAGTVKSSVVPVLTFALRKAATPRERAALARALGELGPAARDALPVLTQALRTAREPQECRAMLLALGELGPIARPLLPADLARQASAAGLSVREVRRWLEGRIGVNDGGDCFSVLALRKSCREIRNLSQAYDVEVLIETVPVLAAGSERTARVQLRDMGPRALYVLLARKGPDVRVEVSDALRRQGFSAEKLARQLQRRLARKENARKEYDRALLDSVQEVVRFEKERQGQK
jgi:hypothetical protein